jgi:aldehyde dehydrogenase (NAD+)
MAAAAKNLIPVTLELGGKNPAIVDRDADLDATARQIVWGKFVNAGQTCIAPDYVLVHAAVEEELLQKIATTVREFYGTDPQHNPDYGRIVSPQHFQRVAGLIASSGATVVVGGQTDAADRYVAPTVLRDVTIDAPAMTEEMFGPVLPVVAVRDLEAAIAFVNERPKPLVLYVFSESATVAARVTELTSSGAVGVNSTLMYATVPGLPFGGIGESGMGASHGRASFETFSHRKSVFSKPLRPDFRVIYPPYTFLKRWLIRRLL